MGFRVDYVGDATNELGTQFKFLLGRGPNLYPGSIEIGKWGGNALSIMLDEGRVKLRIEQETTSPDTYRASYKQIESKNQGPLLEIPLRRFGHVYNDLIDASIRSQEAKKPTILRRRSRIPLERLINYFS